MLSGFGAPNNALGSNTDFYVDTSSWVVYRPKASGTWPAGVSIVGPAESPEPTGRTDKTVPTETTADGASGADGEDGRDSKRDQCSDGLLRTILAAISLAIYGFAVRGDTAAAQAHVGSPTDHEYSTAVKLAEHRFIDVGSCGTPCARRSRCAASEPHRGQHFGPGRCRCCITSATRETPRSSPPINQARVLSPGSRVRPRRPRRRHHPRHVPHAPLATR